MKPGEVTKIWESARQHIKEENWKELEDELDLIILHMAVAQNNGLTDKDLIDGVKREVWLERAYVGIEKHIWPRRPDYIENYEFK